MKLLIVEDHPLYSEGLELLAKEIFPDVHVERTANAAEAAARLAVDESFDMVLLDLKTPGFSGHAALLGLRKRHPTVPVVVVSADEEPATIRACIDAGASGYIPKSTRREIFSAALAVVVDGGIYLPAVLRANPVASPKPSLEALTTREREVLDGVCRGEANKAIARRLGVSDATVRAHLSAVFRALSVTNRTQAALVARERGLIDTDSHDK